MFGSAIFFECLFADRQVWWKSNGAVHKAATHRQLFDRHNTPSAEGVNRHALINRGDVQIIPVAATDQELALTHQLRPAPFEPLRTIVGFLPWTTLSSK